jgi:hypothetical protein
MMFEFICVSGFAAHRLKKTRRTSKIVERLCKASIVQDFLIMYFVIFSNSVLVGHAMLRVPFCR